MKQAVRWSSSPEFWKAWPAMPAAPFARFVALARQGKPREAFRAPDGADKRAAEQAYQRGEIERSLKYCRETLGLGMERGNVGA